MKKSDLKTGMWVEYANGAKRMVLLGSPHGDILTSNKGFAYLREFHDDLTHAHSDITIMAVYEPNDKTVYLDGDISKMRCIWKRKQFKEGDWIKWMVDGTIGRVYDRSHHFPDCIALDVFGYSRDRYNSCSISKCVSATPDEIKAELIKEAERRGFKEGVKFKCIGVCEGETGTCRHELTYHTYLDALGYDEPNGRLIYQRGEWAEIIKEGTILTLDGVNYSESTLRSLIKKATS